MLLTIGKAAKEVGVSVDTLRRWERENKIKAHRTAGGHRRYDLDEVKNYINGKKKNAKKITLIYARVSTPARKNDLENQVQKLELFCAAKGWTYKIIKDIGSGLNYNKKGLQELLKLIETNQLERIVLNYKDRLLRFGSEIVFEMCKYHNVEVIVLNETEQKTYEEELVEDVLSIITVFSAKLYGSRSHKNKNIVKESKKLFKEGE
ncbi:IS607 family transposase [Alkaliphilus hydrothermalis]|uniref:Excisionase family DNA binding protein n=1 Tax=Alkaliphilus hydrothermalis TaxID=1482730 RepID=A0ABS2NNN3_9FIRM|nr:IS607 family transposase [Alkaliphilus hydrothermalis]MBM7614558.1 excisionase family DNA binding protein [Alkaliphilus hydrothermalis]